MLSYLFVVLCSAAPIFDAQADNPWDNVRRVFYSHRFSNGDIYEHEAALDYPPWSNWAPFYNDEAFSDRVIGILDAFLKQPRESVEDQPPLRRAILLRDLWPVFDAQTFTYNAKEGVAAERQSQLRKRLAKIMRRLELTENEAQQLADNFQAAIAENLLPADFDPTSPEQAFLPPDLFNETGPWVAFARSKKEVGAAGHVDSAEYRSILVPSLRVSANRQDALGYLKDYQHVTPVPQGMILALARRMALPTSDGTIVATPIMESLQLIVVDSPHDHHFKFVLDRAELIAGRPGLRTLTKQDPVDAYGFESVGLHAMDPKLDTDGERLVLGKYTNGAHLVPSLSNCMHCHGSSPSTRLFANFGSSAASPPAISWADQTRMIISHKETRDDWKAYQSLRK